MKLATDARAEDFRLESRTWLEENLPDDPRPTSDGRAQVEWDREWQARQYAGGWAGIDWDAESGGRGLGLLEQIIWHEELVRARAPRVSIFDVALAHAGPTLIVAGSAEQKEHYLPRILKGETPWCQGFSEPGAGSDLASITTRGVIDGDEIVVTGQKIWTTGAEFCTYGELLVRTDPDSERHRGLTWLIMDMNAPGVEIRPITSIDGFAHNCEVFFDEARFPVENIVGGIGNGWSVAMSTLAAERGTGFLNHRLEQIQLIEELISFARTHGLLADSSIADRLARARSHATALRSMAYLAMSTVQDGKELGFEASSIRAYYVQKQVEFAQLALDLHDRAAIEWSDVTAHWLAEFMGPIAGGTLDIQKNIIGERVLGLPR